MAPGPTKRRGSRVSADIQKQLHFHSLAVNAAKEWRTLADAGKSKEAARKAREVLKWEKEWQRYGGKGRIKVFV